MVSGNTQALTGRRTWVAAVIVLLVAELCCGSAARAAGGCGPVAGDSVMVVSAHPLATDVGVRVLRDDGNAVDAAVAVAFALAVVEPYSSGLGGGGFAVAYDAMTGDRLALDCRETAPAAARRDMYLVSGQVDTDLSQSGSLSVAVPGLVAGLWELHQRAGRLSWSRLLAPAVRLAAEGFPVSRMLRERIVYHVDRFNQAAREIFLPRGRVPALGQILVQRDLAATLRGVAANGPDAFYRGAVATALSATVREGGGILTVADLQGYRPCWREPLCGSYRGLTVCAMPPPSSGGVHLLQMLNILSATDLGDPFHRGRNDDLALGELPGVLAYDAAPVCHYLVEAMKFAYADRSRYLGDPDFAAVPVARLTSTAYADSLRGLISPDTLLPWQSLQGATVVPVEGNAVAATLTINLSFGSGWVAAGTGVLLNDEMDDFAAAPGVPNAFGLVGAAANAIAPGKRPLSSMTPTIVLAGEAVFLVTGSPGGSRIITTVLQTLLNVVDHGLDVATALRAPRLHHQWFPPVVYHEPHGLTHRCARGLRSRGHTLQIREAIGNAQTIVVDLETDTRYGASDRRGMGLARGF